MQVTMFLIKFFITCIIGYLATWIPCEILHFAGFQRTGVKPKTLAATLQARHKGVIPRNSYFAIFQKWGMAGVPPMISVGAFALGARTAYSFF